MAEDATAPKEPRITSWEQLPLVVDWVDMARLLNVKSYDAVRAAAKRGAIPQPAMSHPMRWYRSDLERHMRFTTMAAQLDS